MKTHRVQTLGICRRGVTVVEILIVAATVAILATVLVPVILYSRESARRSACSRNLATLTQALLIYHDQHKTLPSAAVWSTTELQSLALQQSKRWDLFVRQNWAVSVLPQLNQQALGKQYHSDRAMAATENAVLRMTSLPGFNCPSDKYNRSDNHFRYEPVKGKAAEFARGNYGINGGTNSFHVTEGSTTTPTGDHAHLLVDTEQRKYEFWGNGIAGFNKAFRLDDFQNGKSTLVALEEIRAGIHPVDPRGAWSLGLIAASVTWGHGVNGDAAGPNNPWARSDDIQGCSQLHDLFGPQELIKLGMPCVSYLDENQNAAARSLHIGGVNVSFLDGAVRFIANDIDPALWHVIHARETPSDILAKDFGLRLNWTGSSQETVAPQSGKNSNHSPNVSSTSPKNEGRPNAAEQQAHIALSTDDKSIHPTFKNSIDMEFVEIPAGEFVMGTPDPGAGNDLPPETPPHPVRITSAFHLARTEVTQEQYRKVMGENPSWHQPPRLSDGWSPQFPVERVSWSQAVEFCRKLSALPAERTAGRSYRLPTEAEWEYACRANTAAPENGQLSPEGNRSEVMAGINPAMPIGEVGRYPANRFGLFDMRGNAWEWCSDWFDRDYYARSRSDNPAGPADGYLKVVRGADWIYVGEACFINYPILAPWKSSRVIGFRTVCESATVTGQ